MPVRVEALTADDDAGCALVAARMAATLVEVLGAERAAAVHTPEQIRARLDWHLAPEHAATVLLARGDDGALLGHTLLRVDRDPDAAQDTAPAGLFATIQVARSARRRGVAALLIASGEAWMVARGLTRALTWTDVGNAPLVACFEARGYACRSHGDEWLVLSRALTPRAPLSSGSSCA